MIGLGTQDDADYAVDFVVSRSTYSFPMYWDETFQSWNELGVARQPAAVLFSAEGAELARWQGMFDAAEVLELSS